MSESLFIDHQQVKTSGHKTMKNTNHSYFNGHQ
jgi:hypothetical protein